MTEGTKILSAMAAVVVTTLSLLTIDAAYLLGAANATGIIV